MNICRNVVFRKFLMEEVRPVELRGQAFPALFFLILWVGFTNFETPCDVPDSVYGLHLRRFCFVQKIGESSTSRISRALERRSQKWLVKIVPPTFEKYHLSGILVVMSRGTLRKKKKEIHDHLRLVVVVSGVCLVVGISSSPREKGYPGAWENWTFSVARLFTFCFPFYRCEYDQIV